MKVLGLVGSHRSPRTPYSTWDSDDRAKDIVAELADQRDGWF